MSIYEKEIILKDLFESKKISENVFNEEMGRVQFERQEGIEVNSYVIDSVMAYHG